ncbi:MAG: DUF1330 domain-containing protein [Candidatus Hydrogenedentota bacterium]|nr:MAG: DUF1330 domain-containing protein [Candidatus Hydrogenedentota bacterium]
MVACLIGHITVKEPELWNEYVGGVQESLIPFGGEVLFRGKRVSVLAGEHPHTLTVVIKFSDQNVLQEWFHSEKYQSLIPIRDRAADVVIISYDT